MYNWGCKNNFLLIKSSFITLHYSFIIKANLIQDVTNFRLFISEDNAQIILQIFI